ncbi:kinase-like domain-containing protein [Bombardia bombarda]|uniref:non-specific serine/threonine protein kinase n=1 Tax=Bombardia bombarda TaxID=252184 RepID=A0AA39XJP6_9PEZI|nr:kinase-like domain-containing protein [Bombardia bombarda]
MPLYEGSLYGLLRRERQKERDVGPELVRAALAATTDRMLSQILDALDFIHTRDPPIIHRDIKPANILYRGDKFLLTDFGIAKIVDTSTTMVGSCWYVAPEVRLSGGQTPEVDIYGLGATVVECLVELPPETERASKWPYWEQWHQELRSLLNEHASPYAPMVADNAEHRFSARELLDTFNRPAHIPSQPQANVGWTSLGLSMQQEANQSMTGNSAPPSPMDWTQTGAIAIFRGVPRPVLEDTTAAWGDIVGFRSRQQA